MGEMRSEVKFPGENEATLQPLSCMKLWWEFSFLCTKFRPGNIFLKRFEQHPSKLFSEYRGKGFVYPASARFPGARFTVRLPPIL